MGTIMKSFTYYNNAEPLKKQTSDKWKVIAFVLTDKGEDVTRNWDIKIKRGLFKGANKSVVSIPRRKKRTIFLFLTPPDSAPVVGYKLHVYMYWLPKGDEDPSPRVIQEKGDLIQLPLSLAEAKLKDLHKIPEDVKDLRKIHGKEAFTHNPFVYLSKYLFEPKALHFQELTELKNAVDQLWAALGSSQQRPLQSHYDRVVRYFKVLDDTVKHQAALTTHIEQTMGKWAFTYKKNKPDGLEKRTWDDPEYEALKEMVLKKVNDIRARIIAYINACEEVYQGASGSIAQNKQPQQPAPTKKAA